MSNIGKQRVLVPKDVNLNCNGWKLSASGKYGKISICFPRHTSLIKYRNYLIIGDNGIGSSVHGSFQRKMQILLDGLSVGYIANLRFVGVGYRARIEEKDIILRLGFSHEINVALPHELEVSIFKRTSVKICGSNLENVNQFAYKLRSFRTPEPFKGKGIVFNKEKVRRKEGKKKKT